VLVGAASRPFAGKPAPTWTAPASRATPYLWERVYPRRDAQRPRFLHLITLVHSKTSPFLAYSLTPPVPRYAIMKPLLYITPLHSLLSGLTLALFELLTYLASDAVMPAMPVIVGDLDASPEYIPHALNLYLLGGVVLQWLIGPLADRYGRRPLLLIGCAF